MQMADTFHFVEKENFLHQGIVEDGNVIAGIGMFFREFAEAVLKRFGYDVGANSDSRKPPSERPLNVISRRSSPVKRRCKLVRQDRF